MAFAGDKFIPFKEEFFNEAGQRLFSLVVAPGWGDDDTPFANAQYPFNADRTVNQAFYPLQTVTQALQLIADNALELSMVYVFVFNGKSTEQNIGEINTAQIKGLGSVIFDNAGTFSLISRQGNFRVAQLENLTFLNYANIGATGGGFNRTNFRLKSSNLINSGWDFEFWAVEGLTSGIENAYIDTDKSIDIRKGVNLPTNMHISCRDTIVKSAVNFHLSSDYDDNVDAEIPSIFSNNFFGSIASLILRYSHQGVDEARYNIFEIAVQAQGVGAITDDPLFLNKPLRSLIVNSSSPSFRAGFEPVFVPQGIDSGFYEDGDTKTTANLTYGKVVLNNDPQLGVIADSGFESGWIRVEPLLDNGNMKIDSIGLLGFDNLDCTFSSFDAPTGAFTPGVSFNAPTDENLQTGCVGMYFNFRNTQGIETGWLFLPLSLAKATTLIGYDAAGLTMFEAGYDGEIVGDIAAYEFKVKAFYPNDNCVANFQGFELRFKMNRISEVVLQLDDNRVNALETSISNFKLKHELEEPVIEGLYDNINDKIELDIPYGWADNGYKADFRVTGETNEGSEFERDKENLSLDEEFVEEPPAI